MSSQRALASASTGDAPPEKHQIGFSCDGAAFDPAYSSSSPRSTTPSSTTGHETLKRRKRDDAPPDRTHHNDASTNASTSSGKATLDKDSEYRKDWAAHPRTTPGSKSRLLRNTQPAMGPSNRGRLRTYRLTSASWSHSLRRQTPLLEWGQGG